MALVDKIEELGAAIDRGDLSRDEAAEQLQQYSGGSLTLVGAENLLAKWRSVRTQVADELMYDELVLAAEEAELRRQGRDSAG